MASLRLTLNSAQSVADGYKQVAEFWKEHRYVNLTVNDRRSLDQNAAIRVAYKQVMDKEGARTGKEIERHFKMNYGAPILAREDVVFGDLFMRLKRIYSYEQMLKVMDTLQITSHKSFSTAMAGEMLESIIDDHPYIVIEKKTNQ